MKQIWRPNNIGEPNSAHRKNLLIARRSRLSRRQQQPSASQRVVWFCSRRVARLFWGFVHDKKQASDSKIAGICALRRLNNVPQYSLLKSQTVLLLTYNKFLKCSLLGFQGFLDWIINSICVHLTIRSNIHALTHIDGGLFMK